MVNDILEFSKSNTQILSLEHIHLTEVINEVLLSLNFSISEANPKIIITNCNFSINGNYIKIKQVIKNIDSNALKFRIKDRTPVINISAIEKDDYLFASIRDNGIGIEENILKRYLRHLKD